MGVITGDGDGELVVVICGGGGGGGRVGGSTHELVHDDLLCVCGSSLHASSSL